MVVGMVAGEGMGGIAIARTVKALRRAVAAWRATGERVALVPTMGALHEGHLALVRHGRRKADRLVVSIFVNPTQFGQNEDLAKYPRTFREDCRKLEGLADLVFAPGVEEMYPPGFATTVSLAGPAAAELEDRFRPGHFTGVATVVAKLLMQAQPDIAIFGEKDYQQLLVVKRMVADLSLPVTIVASPTVREPDGLAMSSRNRFLSPQERAKAPLLYRILMECAETIRASRQSERPVEDGRARLVEAGFTLDHLEVRDAETLTVPNSPDRLLRLLAAARLPSTRLIDNVPV
jgi:pantoate--beta-alanine ligase